MIPEVGTRSQIKAACIRTCTTPAIGEVYSWEIGQVRDYWMVVRVTLGIVRVMEYISFFDGTCYLKQATSRQVSRRDWETSLLDGLLVYQQHGLPPVIDTVD